MLSMEAPSSTFIILKEFFSFKTFNQFIARQKRCFRCISLMIVKLINDS